MPVNDPQKEKALTPPQVLFKQVNHAVPPTLIPHHISERLIKGARGVRVAFFGLRAAFVAIAGVSAIYEKYSAEEASELIKDFCYKEAGRSDFKIKTEQVGDTSFSTMGNTLYVPGATIGNTSSLPRSYWLLKGSLEWTLEEKALLEKEQQTYINEGPQYHIAAQIEHQKRRIQTLKIQNPVVMELEYEKLMDLLREQEEQQYWLYKKRKHEENMAKNKARLNLFKGIIDHEMGHLNNYDRYRRPLFLIASMIGMESLWGRVRPQLEANFKKSTIDSSSMFKNTVRIGGRWLTKLAIPTAVYTGTFFIARQLIRTTIEKQADANVRDDLEVLTAMEQWFRQRSIEAKNETTLNKCMHLFFATHPSDESRADYFAQRIEKLENKPSP